MFSSHSSFKCGRFSTEKLVSNRQCPVRSVCVAHITQALVTAAFLAGSVLWSGFLSPLGTCPASPMKRPSLSVSEKGNKGCWLICFKTLALREEMASPVYFLFPFCKTVEEEGRYTIILKVVSSTVAGWEEGYVVSQGCCSSAIQQFIVMHFKHGKFI